MRHAPTIMLYGAVIFLFTGFIGCGAIFNGSTKSINVQASPSGTKVITEPPTGDYVAPTVLQLERKNSYVLTFSKEGYNSSSVQITKKAQGGIIVLDVLLTGLIGVVVDAATGSWNNLSPDQVSVSLEKMENSSVEGPESIEITLTSEESSDGNQEFQIESSQPVGVSVETLR